MILCGLYEVLTTTISYSEYVEATEDNLSLILETPTKRRLLTSVQLWNGLPSLVCKYMITQLASNTLGINMAALETSGNH